MHIKYLKEEAIKKDGKHYWFKVGKIIEFENLRDINKFLRENDLIESEFAEKCLFNLYEVITENRVINYYLETSQELDKVLNIFIRVNSGGIQLSHSDLLLSIATSQWKTKDAREEITSFVDELNQIGDSFEFDKDFVLKSCLVLPDLSDIAFKVDNFNLENMNKIEKSWENIMKSLRLSVDLISSFGYNHQNLPSANAIIPIAYYILKKENPDNFVQSIKHIEDRNKIKKWLLMSLLKKTFSGQPDNVLRPIRNIIKGKNDKFPFDEIINEFKGTNKSLIFTADDIENLTYSKYGQSHTFSILSLIYPTFDLKNRFHQDHIYPRSFFRKTKLKEKNIPEEKYDFYLENYDYICNLQLLEGLPNEEKSDKDFKEWLEKTYLNENERKEYMEKHFIPQNISLDFNNFEEFIKERKGRIIKRINEYLLL